MKRINERIAQLAADTTCDIGEHLETLKSYSAKCDRVVEFGVRTGNSTLALLAGQPVTLISYDIEPFTGENFELIMNAEDNFTEFYFEQASTLDITIEECDMLFIDTEHTYKQLRAELEKHGNKASKFIIFHDTVAFGYELLPAINEFIEENPHWYIAANYYNNNGLMILERKA